MDDVGGIEHAAAHAQKADVQAQSELHVVATAGHVATAGLTVAISEGLRRKNCSTSNSPSHEGMVSISRNPSRHPCMATSLDLIGSSRASKNRL